MGDAAEVILDVGYEDEPEQRRTLIAVDSRGLGLAERLRLGSVSTRVLGAASGPVLVHPAPE